MGTIAKKCDDVTPEMWQQVNQFNRGLAQEFLESKIELS